MRDNVDAWKDTGCKILEGLLSHEPCSSNESDCEESDKNQLDPEDEYEPETESVGLTSSESEGEINAQDKEMMRCGHNTYLPSEKRGLAKFIAEFTLNEWKQISKAQIWLEFHLKVTAYPANIIMSIEYPRMTVSKAYR